ncbi:NUDIX hydrolase domain-like protein [Endogone sp. FLAS-F59071]|nr:NUDIX hydrolase domain-like protein [Endogone sp. FLAS-F59071]|eukprot:RUS14723.1 NUDIX hydrolase domain-like protein [Endogone sp. FLAS-F59071]
MDSIQIFTKKIYTLTILHIQNEDKVGNLPILFDTKVLLGLKKRGLGVDKWNGFGGKLEPGETIEEAAKREMQEESDVQTPYLEKAGVLLEVFAGDPVAFEIHVFRATSFVGSPSETEEMIPQWFPVSKIPYAQMWPEARLWWPYFFAGRPFVGTIRFSQNPFSQSFAVEDYKLDHVDILPEGIQLEN